MLLCSNPFVASLPACLPALEEIGFGDWKAASPAAQAVALRPTLQMVLGSNPHSLTQF
jgi:hypothetical protein